MSIADGLVAELRHEVSSTRKLLERIPEEHLAFRPHAKSYRLAELASHVVHLLEWTGPTIDLDVFEIDPANFEPWIAASVDELLTRLDETLERSASAIARTPDERMLAPWTMKVSGRTVMTLPRATVLRAFILNHHYHHRGQLDVYLRLKDVPLPQIYGPTADEPDVVTTPSE